MSFVRCSKDCIWILLPTLLLLWVQPAVNSVWAANVPLQIPQVAHAPQQPKSNQPIVVTAKTIDPNGMVAVNLAYQIVRPGHYIPAWLPVPLDVLKTDVTTARQRNPEFEDPGKWTVIKMTDDGTGSDAAALDGIFTGAIPGQPHRTMVRYRITATERSGQSLPITVPYQDDEAINFACWVYDGVPAYVANSYSVLGTPHTYSPATLETLPVYTMITRAEDLAQCLAYDSNDQIPCDNTAVRRALNWEGAFVFEGQVYDHINYRLAGSSGRYDLTGKRDMKIHFNNGHEFQAKDRFGRTYALGWRDLNVGKMFDDRTGVEENPALKQGNFGLAEAANSILWNLMGVPTWDTHWFHFRVVDGEQEAPDQYHGDFWGMFLAMEEYDGRFLQRMDLPDGNLYKPDGQRHQGSNSVDDASDYGNLRDQLIPGKTEEHIRQWVNYDELYRYLAVAEAVRHYDFPVFWSGANVAFYFEPAPTGQNPYGWLWYLPYDTDLTWGPNSNDGLNEAWMALEPGGNDGKAHTENAGGLTGMKLQFRNTLREFRDLLWNPETINPMLDELAASIADFAQADRDRWTHVPDWAYDAGPPYSLVPDTFTWSVEDKLADMKQFAFVGNHTWSSGNASGYVPSGGQTYVLDQIANQEGDKGAVPNTPTATYTGPAGFPLDSLTFRAGPFSDPQGAVTFGAMMWRIAGFSDVNRFDYDPANKEYEILSLWESDEITPYRSDISIPQAGLVAGHVYRVRVRMKDNTGRWSHWSAPVQFVAGRPMGTGPAEGSIVINEVLAHSHETAPDWIELYNTTDRPIAIGGWFLSDSANDPTKYQISNGTVVPAKGYVVFYENAHFGNPSAPGCRVPFALSEAGDAVYLTSGSNGQPTGYNEHEAFGASERGTSFGRYTRPDGVTHFVRLSQITPGAANAYPKVGPVVINEIMYNPAGTSNAEYVELLNISSEPVALYDAATKLPWRFTDDPDKPGVELAFSGGSDVTIRPGQYVVLVKNQVTFKAIYSVPAGTQVFEWGGGKLDNSGAKLDLTKAFDTDGMGTIGWVRVDRVTYSDGSHPAGQDPWPTAADGNGMALARVKATDYGNDPANWKAAPPSPGKANHE